MPVVKQVPNGWVSVPTPEEAAAAEVKAAADAAAAVARDARQAARLARLKVIRDAIKAGTDTAADRAKAIRLLIGVVLNIDAEDSEA